MECVRSPLISHCAGMDRAVTSRRLVRALHDASPASSVPRSICGSPRQYLPAAGAGRAEKTLSSVPGIRQRVRQASTLNATVSANPSNSSPLPDVSTHYSIFPQTIPLGPPPAGSFNIDLAGLRREFLQLQGRFHPDKFPPGQKSKAETLSARINEAYKALRDPLSRAQYLLSHTYGVDVTSEDNSAHPADPNTLMEVMEAQERIEEAKAEDQIARLKEQNQERIEQTLKLLEAAFSSGNVEAARTECIKLRYWASLGEGLDAWNGRGSEVRLVH